MKKKVKPTIIILALLAIFAWTQNEWIQTSQATIQSSDLPEAFDGLKILQISDLHNHRFGRRQDRLIEAIEAADPDLIVMTGDLIDRRRFNLAPVEELLENLPNLPVYYVSGNHEVWSGRYPEVKGLLAEAGWQVLDNERTAIKRGDASIQVIGLMDPATRNNGDNQNFVKKHLNALSVEPDGFSILLAHRPNPLAVYASYPVDLVFSGHAHGGQFRLPGIGGLIAPDQGLFPEYTAGAHTIRETTMVVSRGLGNSIIPLRLFNRPELVVVTLRQN